MMLGKLDGKVDIILSQNAQHAQRMDKIEAAQRETEIRVDRIETEAKASKESKKGLISVVTSVIAVFTSVGGLLARYVYKG